MSVKQYGLLAKEKDIIEWYRTTNHYEKSGKNVLFGGSKFVMSIRAIGYPYCPIEERLPQYYIHILVVLSGIEEGMNVEQMEAVRFSEAKRLSEMYPAIFKPTDPLYVAVKGISNAVLSFGQIVLPSSVRSNPLEQVQQPIVVEDECKRPREMLEVEDVKVIPIVPDRKWTIEERARRILSMNGTWLTYDDIQDHIVLVYRDGSHLALILNCENDTDEFVYEEDHVHLIDRLYNQIINCFFDCLASNAIVLDGRTLLLGRDYACFEKMRFSSVNKNKTLRLQVSFECKCQDAEPDSNETLHFQAETAQLIEYLCVLSEFVSEHVERPRN